MVNGVAKTVSGITQDNGTKVYTATFTGALATSEALTLRLNDSAYTTGIILKGARLYKSNTATATVLA